MWILLALAVACQIDDRDTKERLDKMQAQADALEKKLGGMKAGAVAAGAQAPAQPSPGRPDPGWGRPWRPHADPTGPCRPTYG